MLMVKQNDPDPSSLRFISSTISKQETHVNATNVIIIKAFNLCKCFFMKSTKYKNANIKKTEY